MSPPRPTDETGPSGDGRDAEIGYSEALTELETILARLEDDDVDVDRLAVDVERAAALIRLCRGRILTARTDVERVVADLAMSSSPGGPGPDHLDAADAPADDGGDDRAGRDDEPRGGTDGDDEPRGGDDGDDAPAMGQQGRLA